MIDDEVTLKLHQVGSFLTGLAAAVDDKRPAFQRHQGFSRQELIDEREPQAPTAGTRLPDPPTYLLAVAEKYKFSPPRSTNSGMNAMNKDSRHRGS